MMQEESNKHKSIHEKAVCQAIQIKVDEIVCQKRVRISVDARGVKATDVITGADSQYMPGVRCDRRYLPI